jgi:hypothetical protein
VIARLHQAGGILSRKQLWFALRRAGRKRQRRRVQRGVRIAAALGDRHVAAGILRPDQEDSGSPVGLAARHSEPRLPSGVRRVVLPQGGAACSRARDGLRRHGRCEWAGRWAGVGVVGAGRAEQDGIEKALRAYCG